jgi:hypothetical protein
MSSVVLAALLNRGSGPVKLPTLIKSYDFTSKQAAAAAAGSLHTGVVPYDVVKPAAVPLVRRLLESPLCYSKGKTPAGTLRSLSHWCAARRSDVIFHFAKTGTQVTVDPNATVDVWTTGGLQFKNGAAYSYVVLVGTGSAREPWATSLHASEVAAPLLDVLLQDLSTHARANPQGRLLPAPAPSSRRPVASAQKPARLSAADETLRNLGP